MLLNFKDSETKKKVLPLFQEDCVRVARGERPLRAWETDIYVTRRCNMRCSYCYVVEYFDRGQEFVDPPQEQLRCLIDRLVGKTYGLVVLGGEPLIRKDLGDILKYAREKGIPSIRVASNGTYVRRAMDALRYVDRLNISFDSTRKKEFPEIVAKMMDEVPKVKEEMGRDFPAVCVSYTLAQGENFDRDIAPIVRYARDHNFDIKFLPCKYPNKDVDWEFLREVMKKARQLMPAEAILNIAPLTEQIEHHFLFNNCLQGMQYYIDFEGYFLYPCDEHSDQRVGKIYDASIDELYQKGQEKFGRYPKAESDRCAKCKSYCHAENSYNYRFPERQLTYFR